MGIKYEKAHDIAFLARRIVFKLEWKHVDLANVGFIRSHGSQARRTIARCHTIGKAIQVALDRKGYYMIEVLSEQFDKLSFEDKVKTIIHELMHIPRAFGGGFIHHNEVNERNVRQMYQKYLASDKKDLEEYGIF